MGEPVPQFIDFDVHPAVGTVVMLKGQRYELTGSEPYTRRDGEGATLLVWTSHCATCADPFEVKTLFKGEPSRRCYEHRAPGRLVAKINKINRREGREDEVR